MTEPQVIDYQPAPVTPPLRQRLLGLDLLRLFAILLVIGRHLPKTSRRYAEPWKTFFDTWKQGGWVGVDLFFVLSGFLVSGLLFSEFNARRQISVGRFYTRRGWKIYPAFFFFIIVSFIVYRQLGTPAKRSEIVSEIFFLQSYIDGMWSHTWSLAVEEHFYIFLPLAMLLILRLNRRSSSPLRPVIYIAAGVAVLCLAGRIIHWWLNPVYGHMSHLFATHLRLDSLFFGVAIAYFYHADPQRFIRVLQPWRWALLIGGLALLAPAFVFELEKTPFIYTIGLTVFYFGSGMLLVGVLLCRMPSRGVFVWLGAIGAYSYSIYLWHRTVNSWGMAALENALGYPLRHGTWCAIAVAGAIVWGVLMAKLIESPALRLRDRWFPSRSRPIG
ncbi:MAG: acyltransferase [Burkholderiales bacterium]|nr:acyltransferase [Phycisphaerae bacterium]